MRVFCDLAGDTLSSDSLEELLTGQGRVLTTSSMCELLTDLPSRAILFNVLRDAAHVYLDFVRLAKIADDGWQIIDLRPSWRREVIQFIDKLPWEIDQTIDVVEDRFVSTWFEVEAEMDWANGETPMEFTASDLKIHETRVIEKCGRAFAFSFELAMEAQDIMNDIAIEQFAETMESENNENPRD